MSSLPVVIIFERHWDTIPKLAVQELLPDLYKKGYETLCFEVDQNWSTAEIVESHTKGLEEDSGIHLQAQQLLRQAGIIAELSEMSFSKLSRLMQLHVSSRRYMEVAEKMKQLPASYILKEIFESAGKLAISIRGIDDPESLRAITSVSLGSRTPSIKKHEDRRIAAMFQNLQRLQATQEGGVIFVCGALHAQGLLSQFRTHHLQDEVLYYFPHEPARYEESVDDIALSVKESPILEGHLHQLARRDVRLFKERVVSEVTGKLRYTREVPGNSHSQFLSAFFKAPFRAFARPGYHVDALTSVDDTPHLEQVQRCLVEGKIKTYETLFEGRKCFVIPNVNAPEIAQGLRKLSF